MNTDTDTDTHEAEAVVHTIDDILANAARCGFSVGVVPLRLLLNLGKTDEPTTPLELCNALALSPATYERMIRKLRKDRLAEPVQVEGAWFPVRTAKGQRIIDHIFDGTDLEEGDLEHLK